MFEHKDYIYTVYKEKSFTKAANKLFISQPALSAIIKKTEEKLNIQIFDRSTFPISLTQEGKYYIETIEKIYALEKEYNNKVIDLANLNAGSFTVSGANFISSFVLSKIIQEYLEKYPKIQIDLVESNSKELEKYLLDESVDLIFDYGYDNDNINADLLLNETVVLCVPSSFKINEELRDYQLTFKDFSNGNYLEKNCKSVDLGLFKDEKFILLKQGNDMGMRALELCDEAGFAPKCSMYLDQLMTSYNMSRLGMGIALVSDTLIKSVSPTDELLFYKINSKNTIRQLYILSKKNKHLNKAMLKFIQTAKEIYS